MDFKEHAHLNKELSDREAEALKACATDPESFYGHLRQYIRLRYMIEDCDWWSDDLPELAAFSVEHAQKIADELGIDVLQDTSLNCSGTSSAGTKQILLIMALKRSLGVKLTPEELGLTNDVRVLSEMLRTRYLATCG